MVITKMMDCNHVAISIFSYEAICYLIIIMYWSCTGSIMICYLTVG